MRKISLIVDQIDQCRKFIQSDEISYLRMALILLDNASEILMYRKVMDEFVYEDFGKPLHKHAELLKNELAEFNLPALTPEPKRKKIIRFYDEKTFFLSENRSFLNPITAKVLRILHRYRNESFHRDVVRRETIRPLVILFFEIICDLLVELTPSSYSISSEDNWETFCKRYNIKSANHLFGQEFLEIIRNNFKDEIKVSLPDFHEILANHLFSRFEEAFEQIEFIRVDGQRIDSQEETLKRVQLFQSDRKVDFSNYKKEIVNYQPEFTLLNFENWKKSIDGFKNCIDRHSLFSAFADIEEDFEKIENQINEEALKLELGIQLEIDRSRGK